MATDPPDILEQALAEVGPYIGLDTGSEVNPYSSTETGSGPTPYISTQTDNLVQDVQALCTRLAEEGEETLFISVNISGNQCAYLGSTLGKDYIEKNELVQGFFTYCNEKYESRLNQLSTPVKTSQTALSQESGPIINQVSQQPGHNINQVSQQPGHNIHQVSQQPGNTTSQTSSKMSEITSETPQTIIHTPDTVPMPSTGYRSLLTKYGTQEVSQRSQHEVGQKEQTVMPLSGSSVSMVKHDAGPPISKATGSTGSLATTVTKAGKSLDKSIGTDFTDSEERTVPITKSSNRKNQKDGAGEKYVVYIQKSQDSNSKKNVLVYKKPEDLQKDTLKKLGLVKSDEQNDEEKKQPEIEKPIIVIKEVDESTPKSSETTGTVRRRGRPPKTGMSAATVTSEPAKMPNTRTHANQSSSQSQSLDRVTTESLQRQVTRKQTKDGSSSVESPNDRTRRQTRGTATPQTTPDADTKGPFHMRTRSGGKAKHMPWLNKWKEKDDGESNENKKGKEMTSPGEHNTNGSKRKESLSIEGVRKKIKVEVESEDEDPVETHSDGLVIMESDDNQLVNQSASDLDDPSSVQKECEKTVDDDTLIKDTVSEKQNTLSSYDKPHDIGGEGDRADSELKTVTNVDGNENEEFPCNDGSGEGQTIESDDKATEESSEEKCEICGNVFNTSEALFSHMEDEHGIRNLREEEEGEEESKKEEVHQCNTCGKKLDTLLRLKIHEKVHSSGQYVCNVCGKCYLQERVLLRHVNQMHKNKIIPCTECEEMFKSQRQRDEHLAIKHNIPAVLKCKHCNDTFRDVKELRIHAKCHVTPCMCEFCGKSFPRRADLVMHRRVHTREKPIKCHICGRGFARASTLLSHKLTHRTYNAFQCEVCGRTFKTKESMRQHRKVHTKESTVPCEHCDLKFRTFDGMKNHIIQCHPEISPPKNWNVYTCDKCPKRFGGKQQYIRHMSVHTGVRPHECNLCGKSYPTLGALNTHKKIHKECMPERQFHCNVCNHHFGILSKMKRHMETAKHIQYCMAVGVDPMGNLREYEAKVAAEGKIRAHMGGVQVPADGSMPIVIKNEIPELAEYEGDETVECVLIHLPDDEVALQDGAQIVYSINTEDGTIESVFHESAPQEETVTVQTQ
ncbi:protein suppressor of hairy wing-like [Pecten maximus]|uniref:protein suppressor of hairy wing-like n=1 Tax=Pecten maximus TaxID=6579 RepID=UPI0014589E4E|nr:protein suppressor of hairy wing-like [Pecten maximus]XP_033726237.1 protein suppressor of hairy wing-like [Pecten maximus]XP_033726239.1 protein suppressor of hairy wing-like [Pecten maximus]